MMPAKIRLGKEAEQHINPKFVAYNLVFGPSSNGLPDITADLLAKAMARKGYRTSRKVTADWLHGWCESGLLRWRDGQYVVA